MKPSWKDAPKWAKWLARNRDGVWHWFEFQPVVVGAVRPEWDISIGFKQTAIDDEDWRNTLESRPEGK